MTRLRSRVGWFLSADEKKRLVDVFVLLNKLDTRLRCKAASSGKSTKRRASRESKQEKARDMICLYIKGRGPCFIDLKRALRSLWRSRVEAVLS